MKLALIAHGSANDPHAAQGVWDLAARVGAECYFLRQEPRLEALQTVRGPVIALPLLAGHGYFADQVIPEILHGMDHVRVMPPFGTHAKTAEYIAQQINAVAPGGEASVFLISHGTRRPDPGPRQSAEALAQTLSKRFDHVEALFLEQPPFADEWRKRSRYNHVVLVPLTIVKGYHGTSDIPALFQNPDQFQLDVVKGLSAGPEMTELILDLAAEYGYGADFK